MARISVNKLGEYLTSANPSRRRTIIADQKNPATFIAARYRKAYDPIYQFLVSGGFDIEHIYNAIDNLRSSKDGSEWESNDNQNTADALESFIDIADDFFDDNIDYLRGEHNPAKLEIAGVEISVRPDFILHFRKKNIDCIGAIKFHFIKDEDRALSVEGSQYVGVLLYEWLRKFGTQCRTPVHGKCFVVDCFRKKVISAPANYRRRLQHIEIACEEIRNQWTTI